jgi:transposase
MAPPQEDSFVIGWCVSVSHAAKQRRVEARMEGRLFDLPKAEQGPQPEEGPGQPRLKRPNRAQIRLEPMDLENSLPEDHPARLIWEFVEQLDLRPLYAQIRAVEGHPGQNAIDPKILMALWLYATMEGIGSARALDRLCKEHDACRWLLGGVTVNYHTLADFRVGHGEVLDRLLTEGVAALMAEGLVSLQRTAQDGMRVRASAGGGSFHQGQTLEQCLREAEDQVQSLRGELESDPAAPSRRQRAARERARRERAARLKRALQHVEEMEKAKPKSHKKGDRLPRASTTDAEARVMKMADGGFRPAYNLQINVDAKSGVVVGWEVLNVVDRGQATPMVQQAERRYGRPPGEHVVDGGFVAHSDIQALAKRYPQTTYYAPVREPRPHPKTPRSHHPPPPPSVLAWRERMESEQAKVILKQRSATVEWANARMRNRGLQQFLVRGLGKVKAVLLWFVLLHNLLEGHRLRRRSQTAAAFA